MGSGRGEFNRLFLVGAAAFAVALPGPARPLAEDDAPAPRTISRAENTLLVNLKGHLFLFSLEERRLIDLNCTGYNASFSPDGTAIAFHADRDRDYKEEIYVMHADGSAQTRLTNNDRWNWVPAWSPDGRKLAYVSGRYDPHRDVLVGHVYVMNADGTAPVRLTDDVDDYWLPAWSPDGDRIAVMRDPNGDEKICILYVGDPGRAPDEIACGVNPRWSPDGRELAAEFWGRIVIVAAGSSGLTGRTDVGPGFNPAWSPDGRKLAVASGGRVVIVDAANSALAPRTDLGRGCHPTWSPDGTKVIYFDTGAGKGECCIANADGTGATRFACLSPLGYSFSPLRIHGVLYDTYGHVIKE